MNTLEKTLSWVGFLIAAGLILRSKGAFNQVLTSAGNQAIGVTTTLQDRNGSI
jgi:hypothetical protein